MDNEFAQVVVVNGLFLGQLYLGATEGICAGRSDKSVLSLPIFQYIDIYHIPALITLSNKVKLVGTAVVLFIKYQ